MGGLVRYDSHQLAEGPWNGLLAGASSDTLFITPHWQKVWWEQFGDGAEMLLLGLETDGHAQAFAPLARRNGTISFAGSQDVCDYIDFLVIPGAESEFYGSLLDRLEVEEWDTLELPSLVESSPTLAFLPELAMSRGYIVEVEEEDVSPGVRLPGTWEQYLGLLSKKDRHELRRKFRRLQSEAGEFRYYKLSEPDEVDANLDDFFRLMRDSREVKRRFLTQVRETFFRSIAHETAAIGVLKLFFMELRGERVAAAMCFDYRSSRMLYNSGFNREYAYYSVGLLLKALCLQDAIEEGKDYFDFLRGSESYKYDLGGTNRKVYQMVVKRG